MTWPLQRECDRFYGNPRGPNAGPSAKWESANLTLVKCPWVLRYAGKPVKGLRVHKKVAASLATVLDAIWVRLGRSQAEIDRIGMSIYGGGYNFRLMRGGSSLSMHSWGCALDFDPVRNGMGNPKPNMDKRVVEEFEREGWEWGGHWKDGMHFQAAWTRANPPRLKAAKVAVAPPLAVFAEPEPEIEPAAETATAPEVVEVAPVDHGDPTILSVQKRLRELGYFEIGEPDGGTGGLARTEGAILTFRNDNDLPISTAIDDELLAALAKAGPRKVSEARATATVEDLREKGSTTITLTDRIKNAAGWLLGTAGVGAVGSGGDVIDNATDGAMKLGSFKQALNHLGIGIGAVVLLIVAGLVIWYFANRAQKNRVAEYQKGKNT